MKLEVTQENLARALSDVARVAAGSRNALPILSSILLSTEDNRLKLVATNLDIAISAFVGAKVKNEGTIAVPARLMHEFVASLPAGNISLELDEFKLIVRADKYESVINGAAADEFPVVPVIKNGRSWDIPAALLKRGLQQVLFAASGDVTRPVLTGVFLHTAEGQLYAAATDSYRLAQKQLMPLKDELALLVPASALQDLQRVIVDELDSITITADEQQVQFKAGDVEVMSRLIDGAYPDYRKLLPRSFAVSATVSKQDFLNITKVSSLFARESAGSVTITVDGEKQEIRIHSVASQLGENTSSASAETSSSGQVTLNSRFLVDALQACSGDKVMFSFNGKLEACVLTSPGAADYTHIIMPLKS